MAVLISDPLLLWVKSFLVLLGSSSKVGAKAEWMHWGPVLKMTSSIYLLGL